MPGFVRAASFVLALCVCSIARAEWVPAERFVWSVSGRPVIVPLVWSGPRSSVDAPRVRTDAVVSDADGASRTVEASIRAIRARPTDPCVTPAGWLPRVTAYEPVALGADGTPEGWSSAGGVVVFAMLDAWSMARATRLRVAGRTVSVRALPTPESAAGGLVAIARASPDGPWVAGAGPLRHRPELAAVLRGLAGDPGLAWRAAVSLGEYGGAAAETDPVSVLIEHRETLWRVALGAVWRDDPEVAAALRQAVGGAAVFTDHAGGGGRGVAAPVWTLGDEADGLLADVLDAVSAGEGSPAAVARRGLVLAPPDAAWVRSEAPPRTSVLTFGPGAESSTVPAAVRTAGEIAPPGAVLGPLAPDWSMSTFVGAASTGRGVSAGVAPERRAAMLLTRGRGAGDGDGAGRGAGPVRWLLWVEAEGDGAPASDRGSFTLWLGEFGSPRLVLTVRRDGAVLDETPGRGRAGGAAAEVPAFASVTERANGGWAASLALPDELVIEGDGGVLVGVTRVDACGRRSAWPASLLPWEVEPGRRAFDASGWLDWDGE